MKVSFKKVVLALALTTGSLCAVSAQAGMITDIVDQKEKVSTFNSHSYQHDLNDNGFTLGSALSGNISIDIYDDNDGFINWGEAAVIQVENLDFDTEGAWGTLFGSALPGWATNLGINALFSLNTNGFLNVEIFGAGDFWAGDSTLTVNTADTVAVPEPAALGMLGLGLLTLGGLSSTRKRKLQPIA